MKPYRFLPLFFAAIVTSGCGNDPEAATRDNAAIVPFEVSANGIPAFGDIPWPSDLYLDANGHIGEVPNLARVASNGESIQKGLSSLDGFGRSTGALFFLPIPIDVSGLPHDFDSATSADASIFIVDVDTTSPEKGSRYPAIARYLPSLECISVIPVPGVVLHRKTRYAVILTTNVHAADGRALAPAQELSRITKLAANERQTPAEKLYGNAMDVLVETKAVAASNQIASLAVFTTSNAAEEMPALRALLREQPEPEFLFDSAKAAPYTTIAFGVGSTPSITDWLGNPEVDEQGIEWPGGDNPGGIAHDAIAAVASGAFVAPSFLDKTSRHIEKNADDAFIMTDANATIPVTIVIPKSTMPTNGYPVIISGHGLSNNRGSMLSLANELARAGFAMIGIDDVLHGARADIADVKNNFKGSYAGPDGIPDEYPFPFAFFADFVDFIAVRDNFRQTVLDQMSLVRLIQSSKLDLSPLGEATGGQIPKFDAGHIYWNGGSLGGIMGSMTTALEPEIRGAALQVPGAGFVQFITTNSAEVSGLVGTIAKGTFGIAGEEGLDEYHPVAHLLATITESGDPIAYAPHAFTNPLLPREPPDLLVTYALEDEVLPNISTIALIRAFGIDLATPNLVDIPGINTIAAPVQNNRGARTAAAVQYSPAEHALGYNRYDQRQYQPNTSPGADARFTSLVKSFAIEMPIRQHSAQLVKFFSTAYAGSAQIEITAPPIADFDGDGTPDTDDASPFNPEAK